MGFTGEISCTVKQPIHLGKNVTTAIMDDGVDYM